MTKDPMDTKAHQHGSHSHPHGADSHTHPHSHDGGSHEHSHLHDKSHSHEPHDHKHQHGESAHHAHPHKHDSSDDFLQQVKFLQQAEKAAADTLESAKAQSARIEAAGREKAVEIAAKASERAVAAKNETLAKGREQTDKEVAEIIGEAKKQAEKIRGKRLNDKDVSSLSTTII